MFTGFTNSACDVSRKLANAYERKAKELGCDFLNAAEHAEPSTRDSLHMEKEEHEKLARAVAAKILEMKER